ncbi:MAG: glycosyltransferase family 9 protein [Vicinamibacterales bacterium]
MSRILIVRLGALGDLVHAFPVAAALGRALPQARLDWLVDAKHRAVVDLVPGVTEVVEWRSPGLFGPAGVVAVVRRLRRAEYDVVLDLQGLLKSAVLARLSGARRVIGFGPAHLRERAARGFYTETVDPGQVAHVVEKNLSMLRALNVHVMEPRFPLVAVPSAAADDVVRLMVEAHPGDPPGFAAINAGAAWPNKRWPPERFGGVARAIRAEFHWPSCVLWGPGERAMGEAVVAASDGAAVLAPPTTVADIVAIARHARVVVSGDTGPMHLAAAAGAPVVGVFGPTSPTRNGPWGVRAAAQVSRFKVCECQYERRCSAARRCLDDITVDEVISAIKAALADEGAHA